MWTNIVNNQRCINKRKCKNPRVLFEFISRQMQTKIFDTNAKLPNIYFRRNGQFGAELVTLSPLRQSKYDHRFSCWVRFHISQQLDAVERGKYCAHNLSACPRMVRSIWVFCPGNRDCSRRDTLLGVALNVSRCSREFPLSTSTATDSLQTSPSPNVQRDIATRAKTWVDYA